MIKDILEANDGVRPFAKQIEGLKALFPGCFHTDGSLDFGELKRQLEGKVSIQNEGYGLNFLGKSYARLLASLDTTTVITPDKEHNEKEENKNSDNLYISGDNIDALKHLLKSYEGQIKCIYIDPPYNTGSDGFVYNDKFNFSVTDLMEKLSIEEDEAAKILDLTKRKSASHSAWLLFMYPRLQLARDLLTEDGVIFISIDDNEQADLKLLCDDVFGEENCVAQLIWERAYAPKNDAKYVSNSHEYVLMYAKRIDSFQIGRLERTDEANARYKNPDNDPRGAWKPSDMSVKTYTPSCDYPITTPSGRVIEPPTGRCWRLSKNAFLERLQDNRIYFGEDGNSVPCIKRFLTELKFDGMAPTSILFYKDVGHSQEGAKEVIQLMEAGVFDGPKPIRLLERLLTLANLKDDSIVLDFFGGSSSTAHALLKKTVEKGMHNHFILVQLPEPVSPQSEAERQGYHSIDQIGMERIRRAAKKIKEEHPDTQADLGFRHYTLQEPNQEAINEMYDFNPMSSNDLFVDTDLYKQFGKDTILTTWLVRDGYHFAKEAEVETLDLGGYTGYYMGHHLYLIDPGCGEEAVQAIFDRYAEDVTFRPTHVVVFGYNFTWTELENLKNNLLHFKDVEDNLRISVDVRY